MLVTVVAIRDFMLGERFVHRGEPIAVQPVQASALAFARKVSLDPHTRATYRTTNMVAAQAALALAVIAVTEPTEPEPPKARRRRSRKVKA